VSICKLIEQYLSFLLTNIVSPYIDYPDVNKVPTAGEIETDAGNRSSYSVFPQGGIEDFLEMLWTAIVKPVVDKLGYTVCYTPTRLVLWVSNCLPSIVSPAIL
jgi:hypothetical protein